VAHICNLSYLEHGDQEDHEASLGKKKMLTRSHPSFIRGINGKIVV
jgi:hypothetical protein